MNLEEQILDIGRKARTAARQLARLTPWQKNTALVAMADELMVRSGEILGANARDVDAATQNGLSKAAIDRLQLTPARIASMADGIRQVAALPDPVGGILRDWTRPNGLHIRKVRTPIGVVGIVYESRPNVTADAAVLCLKTGNAVILRGGSEALHSNLAIAHALQAGGFEAGLPDHSVQLVPVKDREAVRLLARMNQFLDVIIPRGGHSLIEAVVEAARVPVIKHYDGICHIYVDRAAPIDMAVDILLNAKCQRPGVCNAVETLLVHRDIAVAFFEAASTRLAAHNVTLVADEAAQKILSGYPLLRAADGSTWKTEWLDLVLGVRLVDSLEDAVTHIEENGSHHSDAIVTGDEAAAQAFFDSVDSATVYWNASTRFTDGGEFGFGAEIGISTDKLHARGPMGLEELTTYRYLLTGTGQVRS
jgi:glutamate-5-semialdehyde dehydrogenase